MCGRFTLLADKQEIINEFDLEIETDFFNPSYNIAPGQNVLVIIHDSNKKRAGHLQSGLVPSWAANQFLQSFRMTR